MHSLARKLGLLVTLSLFAFAGGCTGFFVNPTLSSITIGPSNQTITVNPRVTLQMSATGSFSDGSTQDLTGKVLWSSSDPSCATISSAGLVAPAASVAGICQVTINAADGTVTASGATVTVTEGTPTSIVLTATPTNPTINGTVTFDAKATFPNSGTQEDITNSVTWNSSDTTDLTLTNGSGTGTISSTAAAGTTITVFASFDGVNSNTVTLTISQ
jgi:trimeric autotransporter adhesin